MSKKVKVGGKGKNPPQFARIGNGFPVPIKEAFDLLSPNPIDGIRIPLMDLFKKIHETGLGTSRLGPLTSLQLQNDLKAPYATIAGNMLMMGIMIAYAEMEFAEKSIFVFQREKLLQALREYFDLKDLEIMHYRLSSGKIPEPADPGIPYSPDKYPPQVLEQLTKDHAKLAIVTRETLERHQKELDSLPLTVSKQVLEEAPVTAQINNLLKEINESPHRSEAVKKEISDKINAANDKIDKKREDAIKNIKPTSEAAKKIIRASHDERAEKVKADTGETALIDLDFVKRQPMLKELLLVKIDKNAQENKEELYSTIKSTTNHMSNTSISDSDLLANLDANLELTKQKIQDSSSDENISPAQVKRRTKITKEVEQKLDREQKEELNKLGEMNDNLVQRIKQANQGRQNTPDNNN